MATILHDSDCAVHNAPAYSVGPCDCGAALFIDAVQFLGKSKYQLPHTHGCGEMVGKDNDECAYCGKDLRAPVHSSALMKLHDETMAKLKAWVEGR